MISYQSILDNNNRPEDSYLMERGKNMIMPTWSKSIIFFTIIFISLTNTPGIAQNLTTKMAGDWRQYEINLLDDWDNGRCVMVGFTERIYSLNFSNNSPQELFGSFANRFHGRFMVNNDNKCQYHDQAEPAGLYVNTRVWDFMGKLKSRNTVSITAEFTKCMDWGCNPIENFKGPFSTNLRLDSGSVLSDFGDESESAVERKFYRMSEHARLAHDVEEGMDNIIDLIITGKTDEFRFQYLSSLNPNLKTDENFFSQIPIYRQFLKIVASRSTIETRFAHNILFNGQDIEGSFGFIYREIFFENEGKGTESAVLHKENDRWKVLALYLQY